MSSDLSGWETEPIESDIQDYMKDYCITCNSICTKTCDMHKVRDDESDEKQPESYESDEKNPESNADKSTNNYEEIDKHIIMIVVYE